MRKGLPKSVTPKNIKLKIGESVFQRKGNILCLKCCDKRMVTLISSIHQAVERKVKTNFMDQPVINSQIYKMVQKTVTSPHKHGNSKCTFTK